MRRRLLTPEQAAELRRRHRDGKRNTAKALAAEFGICLNTLNYYVMRRHKGPPPSEVA